MNILKISFQYGTYNGKETPFRSEMDKTTSSKQTRSSYVRKEIKTLVFSECYLHTCRLNRFEHINALESIILFSLIPNCLLWMLLHVFYEPYRVLIRFAMYCYGLLVPKNKCLRRCGLIWKRKQHTFGTFGQVNKNCPFSRVRKAFSG